MPELEDMTPQSCPKGIHPDWAVASEETFTCPWCHIDELTEDSSLLAALHAGGVDNWDGYDNAVEAAS